jgi:hypothetical protein
LSGQKDVYALLHSGTYLSTRELASGELLKLSRGEQKFPALRKTLKLDTYDQPVVQKFTELVRDGKMDEASRFLAQQTGYETIGVFGLANHPYLWGTNAGRIAGQFGNWPIWYRDTILRMASRGTVGQRVGSIARLAAANTAMIAIGGKLGIDLGTWSIAKGVAFAGGPLLNLYETFNDAVQGTGQNQEEGKRRLRRLLPYDPQTGQFQLKQIYIPGSFFADDIVKAIQQFQQGNPIQGAAQAAGFRLLNSSGGL